MHIKNVQSREKLHILLFEKLEPMIGIFMWK